MWSDAPEGQCFLADGSGHKITGDDFEVNMHEEDTVVPWTLNNYMVASGVKWASRLRLYCVNMSACGGNICLIVLCTLVCNDLVLLCR